MMPTLLQKMRKSFLKQSFGKDVFKLCSKSNISNDSLGHHHILNPMTIYLYMLCPLMIHGIVGNIRSSLVVTMHHHRTRRNNSHLTQQRLNPYHLTFSMWHGLVLSLNTRYSNCLHLTMPSDKITSNKYTIVTNRTTEGSPAWSASEVSNTKMSRRLVKAFTRISFQIPRHTISNIPMELVRSLHVPTGWVEFFWRLFLVQSLRLVFSKGGML